MNERKDFYLSLACLTTAILSYVFICRLYIGIPLAIISVILFVYHRKQFEPNRIATVGGILGAVNLGMMILFAIAFAIFFGTLQMNDSIDWNEVFESIEFY
jgi:hypothetical protein